MERFHFTDGEREVFNATFRLFKPDAYVDPAIDLLEKIAGRWRRRLGQSLAPRESLREIEATSKAVHSLLYAVRKWDPETRRAIKRELARQIGGDLVTGGGTEILSSTRSAVRRLQSAANRAAKRARRRIRPGPRPNDGCFRELSESFGRVFESVTGQLPRASRLGLGLPSKPGEKDIARLVPKVRTGAPARALAVLVHAAGREMRDESLRYYLRVARAAAEKSRAKR